MLNEGILLYTFAKMWKDTISFVNLSFRPSVWYNSTPAGRIFMKINIWEFFEIISGKLKFH